MVHCFRRATDPCSPDGVKRNPGLLKRILPRMVNYRRNLVPGGTYFFTAAIQDRSSDLLVRYINQVRASFRAARESHPFKIDAIVILPDHLHCLWTLPVGDSDYAHRWRLIKSRFSRFAQRGRTHLATQSQRRIQLVAAQVLGTHNPRRVRL